MAFTTRKAENSADRLARWAEELDRGIADADQGRVVSLSEILADIDATLAEMAMAVFSRAA